MKRLLLIALLFPTLSFAANQAVLTWGYDMVAFPTATFNVYRGLKGQAKVLSATGVTALTATDSTGLATGSTYCWEVTAVVGGTESAPSNEACKTFPASPSSLIVK
jgi:hypothetical protein